MSSTLLSLGQTVLCSVKHRCQLSSEAIIQVAGIPDIALATSHLHQLQSLTNRDIWVRRGHGLRLSIQILLDGENVARASDAAEIVESLGVSLRDGELWSQLGILPTLSLPGISGSTHLHQHGDIVLSLAHISPFGTAPGPSKGRKCRPADIRAAQPPDGVPTADLERIIMILNLSRHGWTPNMKALHYPEKSPPGYPAIDEHSSDLQLGDHIQSMDSHEILSFKDVDMDRWSLSRPPCTTDDEMLDNFSSRILDQLTLSYVETDATGTSKSQDYAMGPGADKNAGVESHYTLADVELPPLLELTDAALRTLISVDPVRTSANIRLLAALPGPKLAEISPALFSPGYLTAVSQRTSFVSTIAYTMGSVSRRVLSSELRAKLVRLDSLSPSPLDVANNNAEHGSNDKIRRVIRARTWRMMQKTLYDPGAGRRLMPIKANGGALHSRNSDDMLDHSSMPSLQVHFDSPLDMDGLHDGYCTEQYSTYGVPQIHEDDDLEFDVLISARGLDSSESGDEDLLQYDQKYIYQEEEETSSNPIDTHAPDYNAQRPRIPCRVYANNGLTGTVPSSQDHPTISDDEGINPRGDGVSLTSEQRTHPPSGIRSTTPSDNLTSVLGSERSNDDEDILFHSVCMMELDETHFSPSNGGMGENEYKSNDEDEDEMIEI